MTLISALTVLLLQTTNAHAAIPVKPAPANTLRCMVLLQEPMLDDGSMGLSLPPAQDPVIFDYVVGTEKVVKLAVKLVAPPEANDPRPGSQYSFELAKTDAETQLTIDFSRTGVDGEKLRGNGYGIYVYTATQGRRNGAWSLASSEGAFQSDNIDLTPKIAGYVILTCVKR